MMHLKKLSESSQNRFKLIPFVLINGDKRAYAEQARIWEENRKSLENLQKVFDKTQEKSLEDRIMKRKGIFLNLCE